MIGVRSRGEILVDGQAAASRHNVPFTVTQSNPAALNVRVQLINGYRNRRRRGKLIACKIGSHERRIIKPGEVVSVVLRNRNLNVFAVD